MWYQEKRNEKEVMTWLEMQKEAAARTLDEIKVLECEMLLAYKKAIKNIDTLLADQYAKLSSAKPADYYNEMMKYKRLETLLDSVRAEYTAAAKEAAKYIGVSSEIALQSMYYKRLYSASWLDDYPEISVGVIPKALIDIAVYSRDTLWTKQLQKRFGDLSDYYPQSGTLSQLLKNHATKDLQLLADALTQGFAAGKSYTGMLDAVKDVLGRQMIKDGAYTYTGAMANALRIIRTEATRTMNAGAHAADVDLDNQGLPVQKMWMATLDGVTRDTHREMDGETVDIDKPFSNGLMYPGEPNCFPGDTYAFSSGTKRIFSRLYRGQIFTIKTNIGENIAATGNHTILTTAGWVAAKHIKKSDKIIYISGSQNIRRFKPIKENIKSVFKEIFDFFSIMLSSDGVNFVSVNLDENAVDHEINVINIDGFLWNNFKIKFVYQAKKILLKIFSDKCFCSLLPLRSFFETFYWLFCALKREISFFCEFFSIIVAGVLHSVVHGFRPVPWGDIILNEAQADNAPRYIEFFGDCFFRHSVDIQLCEVVSVDVSDSLGHVYNLENKNNMYLVNTSGKFCQGFLAHNCRCTTVTVVGGVKPALRRGRDPVSGDKNVIMSYKNYAEWEKDTAGTSVYRGVAKKYAKNV